MIWWTTVVGALLMPALVSAAGYCGNLASSQSVCLEKALDSLNEWVHCDFCLCQEMGGDCNEEVFEDVLNCEIMADPDDTELSCRLVLEQDWLIGFSVMAFFVGSVCSFMLYFYYTTADWSWLWNSEFWMYLKTDCLRDFVTCKHLFIVLSFGWVVPIVEWCQMDFCNLRHFCISIFTYEYWVDTCRPMYGIFCPRWLREICHEQPVFKPSKSTYDPSMPMQNMNRTNQI
jgi:hypothetical protein